VAAALPLVNVVAYSCCVVIRFHLERNLADADDVGGGHDRGPRRVVVLGATSFAVSCGLNRASFRLTLHG